MMRMKLKMGLQQMGRRKKPIGCLLWMMAGRMCWVISEGLDLISLLDSLQGRPLNNSLFCKRLFFRLQTAERSSLKRLRQRVRSGLQSRLRVCRRVCGKGDGWAGCQGALKRTDISQGPGNLVESDRPCCKAARFRLHVSFGDRKRATAALPQELQGRGWVAQGNAQVWLNDGLISQ